MKYYSTDILRTVPQEPKFYECFKDVFVRNFGITIRQLGNTCCMYKPKEKYDKYLLYSTLRRIGFAPFDPKEVEKYKDRIIKENDRVVGRKHMLLMFKWAAFMFLIAVVGETCAHSFFDVAHDPTGFMLSLFSFMIGLGSLLLVFVSFDPLMSYWRSRRIDDLSVIKSPSMPVEIMTTALFVKKEIGYEVPVNFYQECFLRYDGRVISFLVIGCGSEEAHLELWS